MCHDLLTHTVTVLQMLSKKAAVLRGAPAKNILQKCLPCIFDERDFVAMGEVSRYVFIKGNVIFVYGQETDPK